MHLLMPGDLFARRLREQRRSAGMTQAGLAERMSALLGAPVDATAITKIERGDRTVRLDEAVFAAQALGVPLTALVSDRDPVDARLDELRRNLARQESRVGEAEAELRQAMLAAAQVAHEIEQLEASRAS